MSINKLPIYQCLGLTKIDPGKEAMVFVNSDGSEERLTYGCIFENTNRLSHALIKAGIGKGDTFSIVMRNHPEFLYSLFAALSIGAIAVPIDPRSKGEKLAFQIRNTLSKGIILSDEFIENIEEIWETVEFIPFIGVTYKKHHKIPVSNKYQIINEILDDNNTGLPDKLVKYKKSNPVQIIHTSGTTGDPKGVVLKASRFAAYRVLGKLIYHYKKDDILYTGLSMTHGNAQSVTVFPSLADKNVKAVISEKFTKSRLWDICRRYNCTSFSLLGGMMSGIYNEPKRGNDADNPVRTVISAGTPAAIWEDFEKRFNVKIHEWYAAIEGGIAHNPPGRGPIGSFGKPPWFIYSMKIVDEEGKKVRPGEKGELISRMVFARTKVNYFGRKKESAEKTRGGWLRSGDICHVDEKGYFYFDFRKGGGLRKQGDFIQPDYVEKILGEHESISEVCVYGVPSSTGAPGECDIVAAVALFNGRELDIESIKKLCHEKLEKNSIPSYIQVVDEIPKTISEKPLERVLRENFSPGAPRIIQL